MNKKTIANFIIIAALGVGLGFLISNYLQNQNSTKENSKTATLSTEEARVKVKDYISNNLVQPGTEVEVKGVSDKKGLYELYQLDIDVSGQKITAYLTKNGEIFFPEGMNIEETENKKEQQEQAAKEQNKEIPKSQKPVVEAFVMSYCPYGTQIQKGLLPVAKALGDKIELETKFVDYAMHDKKEIDENLRQYCIENSFSKEKYYDYLDCFLKDSDHEECLASVGVSASALSGCENEADQEHGITAGYEDKKQWNGNYPPFNLHQEDNEKYGVKGSPTLVINGVTANSARDPQSLLTTVCEAFEEKPSECDQELSSEAPAPGFGEGTTNNSGGECG